MVQATQLTEDDHWDEMIKQLGILDGYRQRLRGKPDIESRFFALSLWEVVLLQQVLVDTREWR